MELEGIISLVLAGVATFAGGAWIMIKNKLGKVANLARELFELVDTITKAIEDNKIDEIELNKIKQQLADLKAAWNALFKKELA